MLMTEISICVQTSACCCVKFMIIIKMIKIWLNEDFHVMLQYFSVVKNMQYKVHGTLPLLVLLMVVLVHLCLL